MKVTVVTPVYNGMPWLPECVDSVAQQRRDVELEHLIYDAGSTDGSVEWLGEHVSLGYEAIVGPDRGQTDALAKGFRRATGAILGWLNADDVLEPGALKLIVDVFQSEPGLAMVSGVCLAIDGEGRITGALPPPQNATLAGLLCLPYTPAQPATFFSAAAYRRTTGLDRRYDLAMDLDLWLKLAEVGPIQTLPSVVLARYREHPSAKSIAGFESSVRESLMIRRRHGMPIRSRATVYLLQDGFVRPLVAPWTGRLRGVARRVILGPQDRKLSSTWQKRGT